MQFKYKLYIYVFFFVSRRVWAFVLDVFIYIYLHGVRQTWSTPDRIIISDCKYSFAVQTGQFLFLFLLLDSIIYNDCKKKQTDWTLTLFSSRFLFFCLCSCGSPTTNMYNNKERKGLDLEVLIKQCKYQLNEYKFKAKQIF